MYKKTFVSLNFSTKRLQFVQLDVNKKRVERFGSVDIPNGLIEHYKVVDQKALSKVIAEVWKKYDLKEKSVGIVVPEFSTFTKSLTLPQMNLSELDEAVRWQAQEFLPESGKHLVLDWKLIHTQPEQHQVLVVAIPMDVLSGYVESISEAGLFPLIVETPSVSLVRASGGDDHTRIIVYANQGEAIIIITKGEKILGSLVLGSDNQKMIANSVMALYSRYQEESPQTVVVCGTQITRDLYQDLSQSTKLPIVWAQVPIIGLASDQIQEYLIPLSMQLKDPTEPQNENTINLLPPHWVKHYETKHLKHRLWGLILMTTTVIFACLVAIISVFGYLTTKERNLKSIVMQSSSVPNDLTTQIQAINAVSEKVNKVSGLAQGNKIVNEIVKARPNGVTISSYNLDLETGSISISGVASTRQSLLELKSALEGTGNFGSINIPITSILAEADIKFDLDFSYTPLTTKKLIPAKIPIQ